MSAHCSPNLARRAFFGGEAGKSRKVRHAIRGEHEENLSARGWQKEKITIGGCGWSRRPFREAFIVIMRAVFSTI